MIRQRIPSGFHLPSPFSLQTHCYLSLAVKSLFCSPARNLGFYVTDDKNVELHTKNVCRSAYSELLGIGTIQYLLSVDSTKAFVSAFVLPRLDAVSRSFQDALNIFLRNYRRSKTQPQDSYSAPRGTFNLQYLL